MGDSVDGSSSKRTVFVTVGTTSFDALVKAVDTLEVKQELFRRGYTKLCIQMGRGIYEPAEVCVVDLVKLSLVLGLKNCTLLLLIFMSNDINFDFMIGM